MNDQSGDQSKTPRAGAAESFEFTEEIELREEPGRADARLSQPTGPTGFAIEDAPGERER